MPAPLEIRKLLETDYGIDDRDPEECPSHCEGFFKDIRDICKMNMTEWGEHHCKGDLAVWQKDTSAQANEIVKHAQKLQNYSARASESDWRKGMEDIMFRHLEKDPTCFGCNGREWRSFIEVKQDALQLERNLQERQNKRDNKCTCPGYKPIYNEPNRVFESSREMHVKYNDKHILEVLGKRSEIPDTLFGLSEAGRVLQHMRGIRKNKSGNLGLRTGPYTNPDSKFCLFPFFICEAKAAKSRDTSSAIESQVTFAAREMLLVQEGLAYSKAKRSLVFEPLVWCVVYRGTHCSILAFSLRWTPGKDGVPSGYGTDKMCLWTGTLTTRGNALQLILIIDYIADWARDIYRENVIARLGNLVESPWKPKVPLSTPRTVRSLENIIPKRQTPKKPVALRMNSAGASCPDKLRMLPHNKYAFRDATVTRCLVLGLFITEENIDELSDPSNPRLTTSHLLNTIGIKFENHDAAEIRGKYLADMAERWAGTPLDLQPRKYRNEYFLVLFTFSAYFTPDWTSVREMCYIAVSVKVFDRITKIRKALLAKAKPMKRMQLEKDACIGIVKSFQRCPAYINFRACIDRCSVCPAYLNSSKTRGQVNIFESKPVWKPIWMIEDSKAKSRDFVWQLYRAHLSCGIEPNETSYIRSWKAWEKQDTRSQRKPHRGTPWTVCEVGLPSSFVLLDDSLYGGQKKGKHDYCLVILDMKALDDLEFHVETPAIKEAYHTVRLGMDKPWNSRAWNSAYTAMVMSELAEELGGHCLEEFLEAYEADIAEEDRSFTTGLGEALSKLKISGNMLQRESDTSEQSSNDESDDMEDDGDFGRRW